MSERSVPPAVLSIAGSDPCGGAGVQADLKTFAAMGVYGMAAITAVTAQNTTTVEAIQVLRADFVAQQIDTILKDIDVAAFKIGMLGSAAVAATVGASLAAFRGRPVVLDPVAVSSSGDALLDRDAIAVMQSRLMPLATVVTPNIPEARTYSGMTIEKPDDLRPAAEKMLELGAKAVLITGGHAIEADAADYLYTGDGVREFRGPRDPKNNMHGTGCTLSSAIAAQLALGAALPDAVARAKEFVTGAIVNGFALGKGQGLLNHGWRRG